MNSSRPYLIRAIYQWIIDNGSTPHLLVDTLTEGVSVPEEYIENNKIILNIGPMAAHDLVLGNNDVLFNARFAGQPRQVVVPTRAVLAIYARENGQGMVFNDEHGHDPQPTPDEKSVSARGHLRVVK